MANPLKIKETGGGTFLGLQEMQTSELAYAVHNILTEFNVNTLESGTINIDVGGSNKGSFADTVRTEAVGFHPSANSLQTNTYILYQNTTPVNETFGHTLHVGSNRFAEESDASLNSSLISTALANLVSNGLGSYWMSQVNPNSSFYTDTGYYVKDTRADSTVVTYTLWRKTTGVSAPTVVRPAKLSGTSIKEMSDAEIKLICQRFRNRIGTTGIG